MADGHLSDNNRMIVSLSETDKEHLNKFSAFVGKGNVLHRGSVVSWSHMDTEVGPLIRKRFDLRHRKTYNPPKVVPYTDPALLRAFIVGFIDGDGHISKQTGRLTSKIAVKVHISWREFLEKVCGLSGFKFKSSTVDQERYLNMGLYAFNDVKRLKTFALDQKLPILERKWSKIDLAHTGSVDNKDKVVCKYGHSLDAWNLVTARLPGRRCLSCAKARERASKLKTRKGIVLSDEDIAVMRDEIYNTLRIEKYGSFSR